jgi:hypothetical protein
MFTSARGLCIGAPNGNETPYKTRDAIDPSTAPISAFNRRAVATASFRLPAKVSVPYSDVALGNSQALLGKRHLP